MNKPDRMWQSTWDRIQGMIGQRYGKLVVLGYDGVKKCSNHVLCLCDCGKEVSVRVNSVETGKVRSCGCLKREALRTHGLRNHPLYDTWLGMIRRCENLDDKNYPNYGGRGITVCQEWHDLRAFVNDMVELGWEPGLQIDRMDNNGPYCYWNVQPADRKTQARNRRDTVFVDIDGLRIKQIDAWEQLAVEGLLYNTFRGRIHKGWDVKTALSTPPCR